MTSNRNKNILFQFFTLLIFLNGQNSECWKLDLAKINIAYLGAFWSVASLCKFTPDLHSKTTNEGYAVLVERRINTLKFILEKPNEEQLMSFRQELICYYNEILENRAFWSKIVEKNIPRQPWALLDEEINQHINELYFWKSIISNKFLIDPENAKPMLDKIENLLNDLSLIRAVFQNYSQYQFECSLARQEEYLYTVRQIMWALFFFYLAKQQN